ncbi:hypothetical protein EI94DRAFT_1732573 [Lactarius quietus]|nr:hypothetical protein EI94DRAFT_1732573 [Lactarius quietus]
MATVSCNILCDVLITFGMVYTLLRNRTHVRRTNNVVNLLAIYAINYGTLNIVFTISSITLYAKYPNTLIYTPPSFIMIRLYFCAFVAILNSRDNLRETLGKRGGVVITFTQPEVRTDTTAPSGEQVTTEASTNAAVKKFPPFEVSSDASISDNAITFDRHQESVPPKPGVLTMNT